MVLTYDDRGLLVSTTGGSSPSSSTFDAAGRPVTETDNTAGTRSMTYNPSTGLVNQIADGAAAGSGVFVSDNFNRVNSTDLGSAWSEQANHAKTWQR